MGSLDRRLEKLEGRIEPPEDEGAARRRALFVAIMDEFQRLGASCAKGFRGSEPIVPEDIPGQYLAKPYTRRELLHLAIEQVWEREGLDEDLMEAWKQGFKALDERLGIDLQKVEDLSG